MTNEELERELLCIKYDVRRLTDAVAEIFNDIKKHDSALFGQDGVEDDASVLRYRCQALEDRVQELERAAAAGEDGEELGDEEREYYRGKRR